MDEDLSVAGVPLGLDPWSVGVALGGGVKYEVDDRWDVDVSLKWIQLDSDITAGAATLTNASLDPLLFSVGAVYKF